MKIVTYLYYFFRSVFLRGLFNTLNLLRTELIQEKKFGIQTSMIKRSESKEYFHYQGASYLVLFRIFSELIEDKKEFDFVDIGSGRGRAVFVAEYYGFNNLIGIELDEELVNDAKKNLLLYPFKRKESTIEFVQANALNYRYKQKPSLYFLFNPFNEEVLEKVLTAIINSGISETWVVYMNPLYPKVFKRKQIDLVKTFKTRFYTEAILYKINQTKTT